MNRFFPVLFAFVLAVCVASPVFADDVASSPASVASSPASVASSPASVASFPASVASSPASVASSPAPTASPAPVTIIEKPLSDYTPTEGLLLIICVQLVFFLLFGLLKWRFA